MQPWQTASVIKSFLYFVRVCEHGLSCKVCCFLWIGAKTGNSKDKRTNSKYGRFTVAGYRYPFTAHIFMYQILYGTIHDRVKRKIKVCHTCDMPACCNPNHLFLGTHKQNMQDSANKNRMAYAERSGKHKLTIAQVSFIRSFYAPWDRKRSMTILANMFSVNTSTIHGIIHNKWRIRG